MSEAATEGVMAEGPSEDEGVRERSLQKIIGHQAHLLASDAYRGECAELRRLEASEPATPAFWHFFLETVGNHGVAALRRKVAPAGQTQEEGERDREQRWAAILRALAIAPELHRPGFAYALGLVLAEQSVDEGRVLRLLRAHGDALATNVRAVAQQLASKGAHANFTDLAELILSDGEDGEEAVRRGIARDYFRNTKRSLSERAEP